MEHVSTLTFPRTIGIDLGARKSSYHVLDEATRCVGEGEVRTTKADLSQFLRTQPPGRVVIEATGQSRWVAELARKYGHEVVVTNPREVRLISDNPRKSDRNDARILAELGQVKPSLLRPVKLRGLKCHVARGLLEARNHLVAQRTELINHVRGQVRNLGELLPGCAAYAFHRRMRSALPTELAPALDPILDVLEGIARGINELDKQIERTSKEEFPETEILRQVVGVGPIVSLAFVVTIEDPARFADSKLVGAYLGLVSKSRASCDHRPHLRITKRGDAMLRRLLVNAATYIMGPRGEDCDLKRFGERIQGSGGQAARGKARIAVARKLAVLLHRLWLTGGVYLPLHNSNPTAA